MHSNDCKKVVAFTIKVLHVVPDATPDAVCRMLDYARELARLDRKHGASAFEPTATERAKRMDTAVRMQRLAGEWGGTVRYGYRTVIRLAFSGKRSAFRIPVIY